MNILRPQGFVAVGVDDSPGALVAAQYAATLAGARDLDLLLVHAYSLPPLDPTMVLDVTTTVREAGEELVEDVFKKLDIPSHVAVRSLIKQAGPLALLREVAQTARVLVVGHHTDWARRLLVGSIASPLSAKAPCPVIVVPQGWSPQTTAESDPVIIALEGKTAARTELRYAFGEADRLNRSLIVLHVGDEDLEPDEFVAAKAGIAEILAGWQAEFPGVQVQRLTVRGDVDDTIALASQNAALLVIGKPGPDGRLGAWLWSAARALVHHAQCPTAIIPPA